MSKVNKYHKGQKVIFTSKPYYDKNARNDSGKVATIVNCCGLYYDIFIEGSKNNSYTGRNVTWHVPEDDLSQTGVHVQMLFEFMYND